MNYQSKLIARDFITITSIQEELSNMTTKKKYKSCMLSIFHRHCKKSHWTANKKFLIARGLVTVDDGVGRGQKMFPTVLWETMDADKAFALAKEMSEFRSRH